MAILGHFFISLPVFFDSAPIPLLNKMEIFPDSAGNAHIYILLFGVVIGIKRGARLIPKSTRRFPRVATSSRAKTVLWLKGSSFGAAVEVIRDNEPLYSADSVVPSWREHVPRNPHFCFAYQPMLYPFRRFSGFPSRSVTETEQGRSCYGKGFLVVSLNRHTRFRCVFYNDMKKKPVAQSARQHVLLPHRAVYGLLSQRHAAIVVNCFTLVINN